MAVATLLVAGLDQASKALVDSALERGERVKFFLGIDLTNVRNTGVAFGALSGAGLVVLVAVAVALAALLAYFALHAARPWLWLPVGMILGGAIGNILDRARLGAVVDFIDPVLWPAFNVADAAIVLGVLGLVYVLEGERARA
jgi:signal peptidase II